jgi:hypothetical protein
VWDIRFISRGVAHLASIQRCGMTPRIAPPKKSCSVVGAMIDIISCCMGDLAV